jgi:hypothetical protein
VSAAGGKQGAVACTVCLGARCELLVHLMGSGIIKNLFSWIIFDYIVDCEVVISKYVKSVRNTFLS